MMKVIMAVSLEKLVLGRASGNFARLAPGVTN
jgi:hypothetical protein